MNPFLPWLLIAAGLACLFLGGEALVKGAARLALRLGLTPLVVGLTVVAFGTSSPELFVSVRAAASGQGDIAIGNIVGSNIANIGVILAICAVIFPVRVAAQVVRFDMPVMLGVSALLLVFLIDGQLGRGNGLVLLVLLAAYIYVILRLAGREQAPAVVEEFRESMPRSPGNTGMDVTFIVGGLVLLAVGSQSLVRGATEIARALGMSEAVIGLTIVSLGTSLPELSASLVAAFRKEGDIAVGNIVGSNIFNILAIGGLASFATPLTVVGVGLVDCVVMLAFAVLLLPLMKTDFVVKRWEGWVLLGAYVVYVVYLVIAGG